MYIHDNSIPARINLLNKAEYENHTQFTAAVDKYMTFESILGYGNTQKYLAMYELALLYCNDFFNRVRNDHVIKTIDQWKVLLKYEEMRSNCAKMGINLNEMFANFQITNYL